MLDPYSPPAFADPPNSVRPRFRITVSLVSLISLYLFAIELIPSIFESIHEGQLCNPIGTILGVVSVGSAIYLSFAEWFGGLLSIRRARWFGIAILTVTLIVALRFAIGIFGSNSLTEYFRLNPRMALTPVFCLPVWVYCTIAFMRHRRLAPLLSRAILTSRYPRFGSEIFDSKTTYQIEFNRVLKLGQ